MNRVRVVKVRAKVTEQGVTIPKSLLSDVGEVDIRKRNGVIEVVPVDVDSLKAVAWRDMKRKGKGIPKDDPLWELRRNPIPKEELDISDASVNLDKYIYTGNLPPP